MSPERDAEEYERNRRDEERREERNHSRDAVDVSYGGLNLVARGSIVVLVILIAGQSIFTLMTYNWVNNKIDAVVDPQNVMLKELQNSINSHRGASNTEVRLLRDDIVRNRDYLRELGRTCLLTEAQKLKFQQNLSPAMKELLMREYLTER